MRMEKKLQTNLTGAAGQTPENKRTRYSAPSLEEKLQRKAIEWAYIDPLKRLDLFGNTYQIKEELKTLGFVWKNSRWIKENVEKEHLSNLLDEVEKIAANKCLVLRSFV